VSLTQCFTCHIEMIPLEVPFEAYRACPACGRTERTLVWARTEKRRYRIRLCRNARGKVVVPEDACWRPVAPTPALDALVGWLGLEVMPKALRTFVMAADEEYNWPEYVEQARTYLVDLQENGRDASMTLEAAVEAPADAHRPVPLTAYPPRTGFLSNMHDLCRLLNAGRPEELNNKFARVVVPVASEVSARLSVRLWDGRALVTPEDAGWASLSLDTLVRSIGLYAVVEGMEVEAASPEMMLPVLESEFKAALDEVLREADYEWRRANHHFFMLVDEDGDAVATYEQTRNPDRPGWWPAEIPESDDEIGGMMTPTLDPAIFDTCKRLVETELVMDGLGPEGSHGFVLKGLRYELRHAPE
jgi:hypothetical protein